MIDRNEISFFLDVGLTMYATVSCNEARAILESLRDEGDAGARMDGRPKPWTGQIGRELLQAAGYAREVFGMDAAQLAETPLDGVSDLRLITIAQVCQNRALSGDSGRVDLEEVAAGALELVPENEEGALLIDYTWLLDELGGYKVMGGDENGITWQRRALAHALSYSEATKALACLRSVGRSELEIGDVNAGLQVFAGLLENDPTDLETYEILGHALCSCGLCSLGVRVERRALEHLHTGAATGCGYDFGDLAVLYGGRPDEPDDDLDTAVLARLEQALELAPSAARGSSVRELIPAVIDGFDAIPVKRLPL